MSLSDEPAVATNTGVHYAMAESTTSPKGVLTNFPKPLLPKIVGGTKREALIELHRILRSNAASGAYNFRGGSYDHLELTMDADPYQAQMVHNFSPPHDTGY